MSGPLPEARITIEFQPLLPVKPVGVLITVDRHPIATATLENLKAAISELDRLEQARVTAGFK